jgi:hypothetical protein
MGQIEILRKSDIAGIDAMVQLISEIAQIATALPAHIALLF